MAARLVTLLLGLLATTIGLPADQTDPALWGDVAVLTGVIWGTVAYVRAHLWKTLDGIAVHVFAGAIGIALAFALSVPGITSGTPFDLIILGLQATFAATLVDLGLKKAGGGSGNQRLAP
jgi:peptidoglycan/LPS O-acetylase OafA/YrhL